jgi:hypothetical protein
MSIFRWLLGKLRGERRRDQMMANPVYPLPVVLSTSAGLLDVPLAVSQPGLSGGFDHGTVTLTVASTALPITPPAGMARITVRNVSSDGQAVVFIGNADVTDDFAEATGSIPLAPDPNTARRCGESQTLPINADHIPYAISATAGAVVAWFAEVA